MHTNKETPPILTLLQMAPDFHHYCVQEALKTGDTIPASHLGDNLYLIESGFLSCLRDIGTDEYLHIILQAGDFPYLPSDDEETPEIMACEALTDVTWWKIDPSFFNETVRQKDPDQAFFTTHSDKSRKNIENHFLLDRMHPEERIYFTLLNLIRLGSPIASNAIQLPAFADHQKIAEYALTPLDYTTDILNQLQANQLLEKNGTITNVTAFNAILESKNIPENNLQ
ncbi:cyclic nucleotide-binding domain-containing protein [Paenilisteria newyorkensis]|uniref:Crp/Fnr family transcriptional regulator n=1 Tax=Listeria newyorkensis TaxID=1497681 RepID=UPI002358FD97|nr:Crp/Fnr family transcriptional regulator [Listeria newyorkensis]WAO21910.1 Crp/Fnr family transcriptional regulator [Listeria newyorkensis]